MGRKRKIKCLTYGMLNSFVSRNNDLDGYWAIGKIYLFMLNSESMVLNIDMLNQSLIPYDKDLELLAIKYGETLKYHLIKRGFQLNQFKHATLTLTGYPNCINVIYGQTAPNKIRCELTITDTENRQYYKDIDVWCREYNPELEPFDITKRDRILKDIISVKKAIELISD
ncbi:MAG: hypothetical protein N4A72_07505 [Bacteroidales bacterium]|jgi:hypothetical protein|nr:hypothetical protein [Bacteroidales bacterium]